MNLNANIPVLIREDDYDLLKPFLNRSDLAPNDMSLSAELQRAVVIKKDAFPPHAIRINSKIQILDEETGITNELYLVMPQHANIKEKKVSILSPIGSALIGFRKGEIVQWKVPAGLKSFKIVDVQNEPET